MIGEESPDILTLFKVYDNGSCEKQPGIRLTLKVVYDRITFGGQSQNLEIVPQRQYYPDFSGER